jgi:hypothetical protein
MVLVGMVVEAGGVMVVDEEVVVWGEVPIVVGNFAT